MRFLPPLLLIAAACTQEEGRSVVFEELPDPGDWSIAGPGGPTGPQSALLEHCAYLTGGPEDVEHHNLVSIYDGWLVLPWSPEDGTGGLTLFDFSEPCAPEKVGEGWTEFMRESHTLAFNEVDGRHFVAVDYHEEVPGAPPLGGVGFWEITDPSNPVWVSQLALPGYYYPDAYLQVTLSTFWQGDTVYVSGAGNGVYIVDASDPLNPALVGQLRFEQPHLVGTVHAWGNVAMVASAGLARAVMVDISDPWDPQIIPGGDFKVGDGSGMDLPYYFSNIGGRYGLYARKFDGGGPVVYDLSDPSAPEFVSHAYASEGDGGYIFRHEDRLFIGESNFGSLYDFSDPATPVELARMDLKGDFDTLTPMGNVAVAAVDSGAEEGQSTAVIPWATDPDRRGPVGEHTSPADGDLNQATTSRIGVSFDEQIEAMSVHAGSFRVWNHRGEAIPGHFQAQENLVNFTPDDPLEDDTTYIVEIPAGGISDVVGNPTEEQLRWSFSTGSKLRRP